MFLFVFSLFLLAMLELLSFIVAPPRTFLSYEKHIHLRGPQMNYDFFPHSRFLLNSVGLIPCCSAPCVGLYVGV